MGEGTLVAALGVPSAGVEVAGVVAGDSDCEEEFAGDAAAAEGDEELAGEAAAAARMQRWLKSVRMLWSAPVAAAMRASAPMRAQVARPVEMLARRCWASGDSSQRAKASMEVLWSAARSARDSRPEAMRVKMAAAASGAGRKGENGAEGMAAVAEDMVGISMAYGYRVVKEIVWVLIGYPAFVRIYRVVRKPVLIICCIIYDTK